MDVNGQGRGASTNPRSPGQKVQRWPRKHVSTGGCSQRRRDRPVSQRTRMAGARHAWDQNLTCFCCCLTFSGHRCSAARLLAAGTAQPSFRDSLPRPPDALASRHRCFASLPTLASACWSRVGGDAERTDEGTLRLSRLSPVVVMWWHGGTRQGRRIARACFESYTCVRLSFDLLVDLP